MNIFQYLTLFSLYALRVKCMSLDVRTTGMLFLLLYCILYPVKWSSLTSLSVTLLLFSEFLLSSSSNLISLNCTESSNELASTQAWPWLLWSQVGVEALTYAPCTSHTPSLSSWLKFAQPISPLYHTHVPGFLVCVSTPPEPFRYILLSKFTNLWVKALGLS